MLKLQDMTIRQKLMTIIMIPSVAIMLLTVVAFVVWEQIDSRRYLLKDNIARAEMLADNCQASVAFESKEDAEQVLSTLQNQDSLVLAYLYDRNGRLFAKYEREDVAEEIRPTRPQKDGHVFENGYLSVFRQIVLDDEVIGAVLLMDDMSREHSRLKCDILVAAVILLIAMATAYLFSSSLQRMISLPILELAGVAKEVSERGDYSARAREQSNDEVGYLTQVFNTMLEQIQQRDSALIDAKNQLETRVEERTAELTITNEQLTREVAERKQVEKELARKKRDLEAVFNAAPVGMLLVDENTVVKQINDVITKLAVKDGSAIVGSQPGEVLGCIHASKVSEGCGKGQLCLECPIRSVIKDVLSSGKAVRGIEAQPTLLVGGNEVNPWLEISAEPVVIDGSKHVIVAVDDITARKQAQAELKAAQEKLIETAHRAGMAEVASDVLHNVGNVLNSINVSTTLITDKIVNSEIENLVKVVDLVTDNAEDIGRFLTEHPQGKHIPKYLTEVAECLVSEQTDIVGRLRTLSNNIQHIKDIISVQQSYAKTAGVEVQASPVKLVEDAIQINSAGLERHGTKLVREFEELGDVEIDKQKVIQILVNLINNAKYALSFSNKEEKLLTIRIHRHNEDRFQIEVADNGIGISRENLTKIFSHGYTTKKHGHGFGLHSSALAAKEMGGLLTVHSDGIEHGATFTLELPFKPVEVKK